MCKVCIYIHVCMPWELYKGGTSIDPAIQGTIQACCWPGFNAYRMNAVNAVNAVDAVDAVDGSWGGLEGLCYIIFYLWLLYCTALYIGTVGRYLYIWVPR